MDFETENEISDQIIRKRSDICNRWLNIAALLMLVAAPLLIYRDLTVTLGLQYTSIVTLLMFAATLVVAVFQKRVPLVVRAFFPIAALSSVATTGVANFGLVASGFYFLIIAPSLLLIFYGLVPAVFLLAVTSASTIGIGVFTVKTGTVQIPNISDYVVSSAGWTSALAFYIGASSALLATVHVLNKFFTEALVKQARESKKLASSERETRSILEQLVDPYFRVDKKGALSIISPAIETVLQVSTAEITGHLLAELSPEEERVQAFFSSIVNGEKKSEMEVPFRRGDGEIRTVVIRAQPWLDTSGLVLGVEGVLVDITERRAAQKAIYHSRKVEASGLMAAGISHDFNNNLGVISGCLDSIAPHLEENKDLANLVELAQRASQKATHLSSRLHQISTKSSADKEVQKIDPILEEFSPIIFRVLPSEIQLKTDLHCGNTRAAINRSDFEDVIFNLVVNARDAISGRGIIEISTKTFEIEPQRHDNYPGTLAVGKYLCVAVQDTGKGVPADQVEKIFEPFYSTKPEGQGSGLGLSMVRGFAERNGGAVRLTQTEAKGARFELILPVYTAS